MGDLAGQRPAMNTGIRNNTIKPVTTSCTSRQNPSKAVLPPVEQFASEAAEIQEAREQQVGNEE